MPMLSYKAIQSTLLRHVPHSRTCSAPGVVKRVVRTNFTASRYKKALLMDANGISTNGMKVNVYSSKMRHLSHDEDKERHEKVGRTCFEQSEC